MVASFAVHQFPIFFVILFVVSFPFNVASVPPKHRYSVQLIHRDSPQSPFHNPNSTLTSRASWGIKSSTSRYRYLTMKQNLKANGAHSDVLKSLVAPDGFDYLTRLLIGTPPIDIYLVIDPADEFLWTQCEPCAQCYQQRIPVFDPRKSSTYSNVSCDSSFCKFFRHECQPTCIYHYVSKYGDQTTGFVGNEVLTFKAIDGSIGTLPNVTFGCRYQNHKWVEQGHQTGILGLAPVEISLIHNPSLTSPKFSYCVGNLSNPFAVGNLILGEDAYTSGATTPLLVRNGLYYVKLLDISVAGQKLNIPPGTFDLKASGRGGVSIDSGSKLSFLAPEGYRRLHVALSNMLERYFGAPVPDPYPVGGRKLCFVGSGSRDLEGFPHVTFNFDGGADLVLDKWSIFLQMNEEVFCVAFLPGEPNSLTIIGNMAQQFYNFGYDLVNNVVSFQSLDCTII